MEFVKNITSKLLADGYESIDHQAKGLLDKFENVYIEDNSTIALQESLADEFEGTGGNGPSSSMKIYLNYTYRAKAIEKLEISQGIKSDSKFAGNVIPYLKKRL